MSGSRTMNDEAMDLGIPPRCVSNKYVPGNHPETSMAVESTENVQSSTPCPGHPTPEIGQGQGWTSPTIPWTGLGAMPMDKED